ncbi:hypothetical protein ES332_D09G087100v1 [Gossypium tomentosum]|uniref:Uncharacterized protein n=1 Tax=Gossypium tomentosum TaxID=34277 RepID=A0A5D2JF19_GOSTO|nr:hypothetical protein ES332_D09G087100v1 [Gossypium tomentosum]
MTMDLPWLFLFSSLTIAFFLTVTVAQQEYLYHFCLDLNGNFTRNSTYQANLDRLLSSFTLNTSNENGLYNFSSGQGSNIANALALCRGDVNSSDCFTCINNANDKLRNRCPYQREAIIWYDYCMFRYTNRTILGVAETLPSLYTWNLNNATSTKDAFKQAVSSLMDNLANIASTGTSLGKFATGSALSPFQAIYALVQCTPDLTMNECSYCLSQAIGEIPQFLDTKRGGRIYMPSCYFRFEIERFYDLTAADTGTTIPSPPSPPPSNDTTTIVNKHNSSRTTIVVSISAVAFAVLFISSCMFIISRMRKPKLKPQKHELTEAEDEITTVKSLQYDFNTIRAATDHFSDANKLGQGGFGAVYKGTLAGGKLIAVKRLSSDSRQGDLEFKNEVLLMANLQHRNLVRLQGFCLEGNERLLTYEFVPNGSLDKFLFDPVTHACLNRETRYNIIEGVARGILYLHQDSRLRIIHRDLKASNILLDAKMNPKIADFGMARLCAVDQIQGSTNRIVGTYGYMAPEYAMHGQFSVKSDVFSYGVLVLEILSGQKNRAFHNGSNTEDLLSFAWRNWEAGAALDLVDPNLRNGSRSEVMRCIHIGLLCVQENVAQRPNMGAIVLMLAGHFSTLPLPSEPALFMHGNTQSAMQKWDWEDLNSGATKLSQFPNKFSVVSENMVSITEMYPR